MCHDSVLQLASLTIISSILDSGKPQGTTTRGIRFFENVLGDFQYAASFFVLVGLTACTANTLSPTVTRTCLSRSRAPK